MDITSFLSPASWGSARRLSAFCAAKNKIQSGFTAIELLVVISIIIVVSAFTLPSITAAIRRGGINAAADKLQQVINEAQVRARRQVPTNPDLAKSQMFGVAIVPDGGHWYATVLYGTRITDEFISAGAPVMRVPLASADVYAGFNDVAPAPLAIRIGWFFLPGSGSPVQEPLAPGSTFPRPIGVGTPSQVAMDADNFGQPQHAWDTSVWEWGTRSVRLDAIPASPVCSSLLLRSADGRLGAGVAIYDLGVQAVSHYAVGADGGRTDAGG